MPKRKTPTLPSLVRKLDTVFSRFVRMSAADDGGTVACVTCGKLMHWKEAHAGHFISRRHMAVRWDPMNVHPQCCGCNTFQGGQLEEYSAYMIDTFGRNTFDRLRHAKTETRKWTRPELQAFIDHYATRVKELEGTISDR